MNWSDPVGNSVFGVGGLRVIASLAITMAWFVSTSVAATLNYGFSVPVSYTDWSTNLALPQFNPFFGTLQSVTLTYTGVLDSELTVSNSSPSPANGLFTEQLTLEVGQSSLTNALAFGIDDLATDAVTNTGLVSLSGSVSRTYATALGAYVGTGSVALPVATETVDDINISGGAYRSTEETQARLTGTVTYTFSAGFAPVPEPDVNVLLVTGGLLLLRGWFRFRRLD